VESYGTRQQEKEQSMISTVCQNLEKKRDIYADDSQFYLYILGQTGDAG